MLAQRFKNVNEELPKLQKCHNCEGDKRTVINKLQASDAKERAFLEQASRFRNTEDPEEIKRLGDELGHLIFGK